MSREKWIRRELEKLPTPRETPEPPAGLAERIKAEIPERLAVAGEPAAGPRAGAASRLRPWLLAASVVVALGGGFLAYRTARQAPLTREDQEGARPAALAVEGADARSKDEGTGVREKGGLGAAAGEAGAGPEAAGARQDAPGSEPAPSFAEPSAKLRRQAPGQVEEALRQESAAAGVPDLRGRRQAGGIPGSGAEAALGEAQLETRAAPLTQPEEELSRRRVAAGAREEPAAEPEVAADAVAPADARAAASHGSPPAAPPPTVPPERRPGPEPAEQTLKASRAPESRPALFSEVAAAGGSDPLDRLRQLVAAGRLPPPGEVQAADLAAALSPEVEPPPPASGATFRAEGGVGPFTADPGWRRLRFAVALGAGVSAARARAWVDFEPRVVAGWRRLGETQGSPAGRRLVLALRAGGEAAVRQASAVVEIELLPGADPEAVAATLRLRYPSAAGKQVEETRPLRLADLAPAWEEGSPALRQALLAAELGEILAGSARRRSADLGELAREARELAEERSGDPRAAELARLASLAAELARGD